MTANMTNDDVVQTSEPSVPPSRSLRPSSPPSQSLLPTHALSGPPSLGPSASQTSEPSVSPSRSNRPSVTPSQSLMPTRDCYDKDEFHAARELWFTDRSAAEMINGPIGGWPICRLKYLNDAFNGWTSFDEDLSGWDTSDALSMEWMFYQANSFNGDVSTWDVSQVRLMVAMFHEATSFNGDIGGWDTSNSWTMEWMFCKAASFNRNLSAWDLGKVTSISFMFSQAPAFNQCLEWSVDETTTDMWFVFRPFNESEDPLGFMAEVCPTDGTPSAMPSTSFAPSLSPTNTTASSGALPCASRISQMKLLLSLVTSASFLFIF
eukprot:CAMPEP_0194280134 /NCGR_PEP_ID=MMETSP0169-20130528/15928_1 /TAXON_ID=218684 /ORGANISM="Corethron pennatum, Strain L29A3" /LENGTH=319 /DNA_ID=CAMNT_0039024739 /DNA_START=209 /DNA_END=1168 /DNA_ORIENTATION=+